VLPLEERHRQVLCLILKRDLIADQAIASADQFGEPRLLRCSRWSHWRLECHSHAGKDYRVDLIRLGKSARRLREPPRAGWVEFDAWQMR